MEYYKKKIIKDRERESDVWEEGIWKKIQIELDRVSGLG